MTSLYKLIKPIMINETQQLLVDININQKFEYDQKSLEDILNNLHDLIWFNGYVRVHGAISGRHYYDFFNESIYEKSLFFKDTMNKTEIEKYILSFIKNTEGKKLGLYLTHAYYNELETFINAWNNKIKD